MKTPSSMARPVVASLLAVALAGTCLATPAFAAATNSADTAPSSTAAAPTTSSAAADATQTLSVSGVSIQVPDGYQVVDLGAMSLAISPDGGIQVTLTMVYSLDATTAVTSNQPLDLSFVTEAELVDQLESFVAESAESLGATVLPGSGEEVDLGEGITAYEYDLTTDSQNAALLFVPTSSNQLVYVAVDFPLDPTEAEYEEMDLIASSLTVSETATPATAGQSSSVDIVTDGQPQVIGGLTVTLPADLVKTETGVTGIDMWMSPDQEFIVQVYTDLTDGEPLTDLTQADYDETAYMIAYEAGGEVVQGTVLYDSETGTPMYYYVLVIEDEDTIIYMPFGLIPVPDGTLTGVATIMDGEAVEVYQDVSNAVFQSLEVVAS